MKTYTVAKRNYSKNVWDGITPIKLDVFRWRDNGYEPDVFVKLFHDGENMYVHFTTWETEILGRYRSSEDPVCDDSCVEMFLYPDGEKNYMNFETNVLGTLVLGLGAEKEVRDAISESPKIFDIKASVKNPEEYKDEKWTIEYKVPFSFLKKYYPDYKIGDPLRANFYKCGENVRYPHYGMWCEIIAEEEEFHLPEYFGKLIFE